MSIAATPPRDHVLTVSTRNDTSSKPSADKEESTTGIWTLGTTLGGVNQDEYEKNADNSNAQLNTNALVNQRIKKSDESDSVSDADSSSIISFNEDSSSDTSSSSISSTSGSSSSETDDDNALRAKYADQILSNIMQKSAEKNAACSPGKALSYCVGPTLILGGTAAMAYTIYRLASEGENVMKITPGSAGMYSFMAIAGALFAITGSLCTYASCKN